MLLLQLLFKLIIPILSINNVLKMQIIHTKIFNNIPLLKLHDTVILESFPMKDRISIDFVPVNFTFIDLLIGKNVTCKIRMYSVSNEFDIDTITKKLDIENNQHFKILSDVDKIKSCKLKKLAFQINKLNSTNYNLYKYNCKHFRKNVEFLFNEI